MKLFVALVLVAFVGCSLVDARSLFARDTKSTLIAKGNDLIKKADEAITKLEADKKTHEASIVKSEEAKIKKLVADLEAATDAAKITQLEHELSRAEHQLQFELEKIAHGTHTLPIHEPIHVPTKRATKEQLITKGNDLIKKADEAIKKLEADKTKAHEVTVLKHEEEHIKKLITDLQAATEATAITHLEHQLTQAENRLEHELLRINHTPVPVPTKRATKEQLITKGNDLIKKADEAIKKLEADKTKAHEVTVLKHEEASIKKLIADLEAATEATAITHIEHQLTQAENRLDHELLRINHTPVPVPTKRATKEQLITKGNDLIKKADEAIKKLEADKTKAHEVTVLKHEEASIKKLIADLEAATEATAITHIEHQLSIAESRLEHELARVAHTPVPVPVPTKRATKEQLVTKGNDLIKKADEAIKKLEAEKKTHEVTVLKHEEEQIKKLIADLQAATEATAITHIEHQLTLAENRLEHELAQINHTPVVPHIPVDPVHVPTKRATKDELITQAKALLKKADDAIAHLQTGTHLHEVSIVKHQEETIKKLVADLEAATDAAKITSLEHELTRAEHRLEAELTLIQHRVPTLPHTPRNPAKRDTKSDLITKGNDLVKKADEAIKKLEAEKKLHEVSILKHEEATIKKLVTDLEAATDATAITHLEHQLTRAEARLTHELEAIAKGTAVPHTPTKRATKEQLITKGNDLIKKADEAIKKLEADKTKAHEVTVLKHEEASIKKLIADLEAATEAAAITHIEHQLTQAENRLEHELLRINHTPVPVPTKRATKEQLITKGNDLIKKADEAIKKLEADKTKAHEVTVLKHEEASIKKLIADLEAATEATAITHIEHQLTQAENRLEHELLRINHTPVPVPTL